MRESSVPDTKIAVRAYADEDLDDVLDLLRASLGESALLRRTTELFTWKHFENPFGRSILLVAEADDRIVGLRAFMRWTLRTADGAEFACVRAVDTATHPQYQRRGIFRSLTEAAVSEAKAQGVDMVFNTPNPKSGAGYLTMGWHAVGAIGVLAAPCLGVFRPGPDEDSVPDPSEVLRNPEPAEDLDVTDRTPRGLRTPRTDEYLRWRFAGHPTAHYLRIDAGDTTCVVRPNVRNGRRELVLSDVFGPHPSRAIRKTWRASRAAYMAGWFAQDTPERRAATRSGMIPVPRLTTLTLVARPLRRLPLDTTSLRSWDFASSDLELL